MSMTHWPFIIAAYALSLIGVVALLAISWWTMRRAERAVENLQRDPS